MSVINAHLAHVPEDVHGRGLAMALQELYESQEGKSSGGLKNPKKGRYNHVAVVTRDGAWRITQPDWQRGQLPNFVIRRTFTHIRSLGAKPSREKLNRVIARSVQLTENPEGVKTRKVQCEKRRKATRRKLRQRR